MLKVIRSGFRFPGRIKPKDFKSWYSHFPAWRSV